MNSRSVYLIGIWAVIAALIAFAIGFLTSGNPVLAWIGVLLMLGAVGGVANWLFLAWRATTAGRRQQTNTTEDA